MSFHLMRVKSGGEVVDSITGHDVCRAENLAGSGLLSEQHLNLIGVASCWGAQDHGCSLGPAAIRASGLLPQMTRRGRRLRWREEVRPSFTPASAEDQLPVVTETCRLLADSTAAVVATGEPFVVFGGDHSCAIGSWSGVAASPACSRLGLLWIDAHMDSHTPATTPSGAVHGMPLACLLGEGPSSLLELSARTPVLCPERTVLFGVRSYEAGEANLLHAKGVRVYFMEEIRTRGVAVCLREAMAVLSERSDCLGVSIDLDAIDPADAPGVGSPEAGGLAAAPLLEAMAEVFAQQELVGLEIAELNPSRDMEGKTTALAVKLVDVLF